MGTWQWAAGLVTGPASPEDLIAARTQMALSLGWHIILACLGVGMPTLMVLIEWRGLRTGDEAYRRLALQWAKAIGVLFAAGAVSGTILSFELGLLWPAMMGMYGQVIGLPFAAEGVAFFIEAIFLGIYLYTWNRVSPKAHLLAGLPVAISGALSAFLVVCANAWMNTPVGFTAAGGRVRQVSPWRAMFNPAVPHETLHMIVAAFMVAGFLVAGVYAMGMLRGNTDRRHRLGFVVPFTLAAAFTPIQIIVGDYSGKSIHELQPAKLAAAEALFRTQAGAPLSIGGFVSGDRLHYSIEVPKALSLLAGGSFDTVVQGLDRVPRADRAPVGIVHFAFDLMVSMAFALLLLSAWFAWSWWRRRDLPRSRWFLRFAALSGVAAVVATEAGWTVTEVGRQPWTVYGHMRTADAVNPAPGLWAGFALVLLVYLVLTVVILYVLRLLRTERPVAPQEPEELPQARAR
ncbi:cytochrome ubiquinol oxidase subunit I [Sphaerisporangium siamense]|uniref:Cytochrome d ubiquinol oxidase subunit I n=1 Tax=Sphaerisporangium siamense TaxID=795645 RepID=A0A7W7DCK2_9ACTN|nr:cytochrome ubiquinol oxidase subunit I [Sphaerisporangium siamense]MBB4703191.1 cytochrome d ubiquinol oxidase subunit I [Sphaerisporangium siamense]GII89212.1 cytochrome ubiquinol oxidase subunit I [Sphaerisporangium siamense]